MLITDDRNVLKTPEAFFGHVNGILENLKPGRRASGV